MEEYKRITLESYEKNNAEFIEYYRLLSDYEKRKEFWKFLNLLEGNKILDVGCAGGEQSLWFSKQGLEVTGIDLSPSMIKIAKEKGVNAILMDMEEMYFNENSFDGIWSIASLLHIKKENVSKVISLFSYILDKNGILLVGVKEGNEEGFRQDKQNHLTRRYFSLWQEKEMLSLLEKHFELIENWKRQKNDSTYLYFLMRNKK